MCEIRLVLNVQEFYTFVCVCVCVCVLTSRFLSVLTTLSQKSMMRYFIQNT